MKKENIQKLIDRYLDGVTTPDEEKQLARELLNDDIPDEWKAIRMMLGELAMGEAEYDETIAKAESCKKKATIAPSVYKWEVAASVALLIGLVVFFSLDTNDDTSIAKAKQEVETLKQETYMPEVATESNITDRKQSSGKPHVKHYQNATRIYLTKTKNNCDTIRTLIESNQNDYYANERNTGLLDKNIHYASFVSEDTLVYQAPSRLEEFIVKMADYNHVKGESLACSSDKNDSLTVSTAYVFEDTKELNLFSRLLQAACWYNDTTPGYLLNYSHQQFFFRLKDMHIGLQYLWIAERIQGKILLYCTHSPLDSEVSSDCYIEYRDKLSNTLIKTLNSKEI